MFEAPVCMDVTFSEVPDNLWTIWTIFANLGSASHYMKSPRALCPLFRLYHSALLVGKFLLIHCVVFYCGSALFGLANVLASHHSPCEPSAAAYL
jgi:hypothetical protein